MYSHGLNSKTELIGKKLENLDFIEFEKKRGAKINIYSHRMLTNFNSTYMEFLDQWSRNRGGFNFMFSGIFTLGLIILLTLFYFIIDGGITLFLFIALIPMFFLIKTLTRLYNTYIYFPIRFNRKTRQVYMLGTDKQFRIFDWEQLRVGIFNRVDNRQQIVLLDVAEDGTVLYDFALPFDANIKYQEALLLGHWEFVRRYMDGNVNECFEAIQEYYPAFGRKETLKENIYHIFFIDRYDEDPQPIIETLNTSAIVTPLWSWGIFGRFFSNLFNKTPFFPAEIEDKCQVAGDDPLDIKKSDIPTQMKLNLRFGQKVGVAIRLSMGLFVAIFFIEFISKLRGGEGVFGLL